MLLDSASMYFRAFYGVPATITAPDRTPLQAVPGAAAVRRARSGQGGTPRARGGRREVRGAARPGGRGVRRDGDAARRPLRRAAGRARRRGEDGGDAGGPVRLLAGAVRGRHR